MPEFLGQALKQPHVLLINIIGFVGIALIAYGIVASLAHSPWPVLERLATGTATYATLAGALLTTISIYAPVDSRPPDAVSKVFTAPIMIVGIVAAFGFMWFSPWQLPSHVVSGFAVLALSGALFRLASR